MRGRGSRGRIGIAVGARSITGVLHAGGSARVATVPLALPGDGAPDHALETAFAQLNAELGAAAGSSGGPAVVHFTLLPPLSDVRLVQLPPLRTAEALAVLRRDAGRYFVAVPAPRVVGIRTARNGPALAAAAGEAFVDSLRSAAAARGWRTASVTPAAAAWFAAAGSGSATRAVVAVADGTAHLIGSTDGIVTAVRRVPAHDPRDIAAAAFELHGGAGGPVAIFAEEAKRSDIARALSAAGWTPAGPELNGAEAAARHAGSADLELVPGSFAADRRRQETRVAVRLAIAAVLLFAATGAVELWGARSELTAVRERRAEIRATVEPLLALRDSADRLSAQVGDIDSIARGIPRWTGALFDLSMLLPPEAWVTRLHATGDTLVIDAEGARAGAVLEALRGAGTLRDVKLLGAVDRQLTDGATTSERFRISARLAARAEAAR